MHSDLSDMQLKLEIQTKRADHAENLMQTIKYQLENEEKQNRELNEKFNELRKSQLELQTNDRTLRLIFL